MGSGGGFWLVSLRDGAGIVVDDDNDDDGDDNDDGNDNSGPFLSWSSSVCRYDVKSWSVTERVWPSSKRAPFRPNATLFSYVRCSLHRHRSRRGTAWKT